ncbi:MAG: Rne/Rng family ribonuclease [Hyphomicrobiales bacterium]|nr:Rne/Rng family ribonuclease [Hyphomicrobiales bacterium]
MDKTNKMLIDATHPEETRVVVLRNGRVEEFDYENAARKPLRGNIYLAKVTRVEPSLQAAFVEYGGNRHGFLAFNEIHPDYYQIPKADREALLEEEAQAEAEADAEADARAEARGDHGGSHGGHHDDEGDAHHQGDERPDAHSASHDHSSQTEAAGDAAPAMRSETDAGHDGGHEPSRHEGDAAMAAEQPAHAGDVRREEMREEAPARDEATDNIEEVPHTAEAPETVATEMDDVGGADVEEEMPERPRRQRRRHYKIQEVIKRRQIILVQVVKEERGNKGAALTTYLSLAGRYTVLMPNTGRGGGISRKITNMQDRKRLKSIAQELDIPDGMGLIVRTAGASRTKQEIRRDYEYLMRLWESVREMAIESTAPSLVYEEGNLIKRSIRDQYSKDVDEIVVAGAEAHREAQDFMGMLMPAHAENVVLHDRPEPLFARYQIERQLNSMFSPYVTLRSGGYLVINQTEALVSIDVNSGKSTREFSIEETALQTNLEASDEIARQLRLRDLAGLIVIDFIDMEEKRNNRAVERRLKDALRFDRARIQVGRISHFGLLEMSRQRLRNGVLEGSTSQCPHCQGTGIIRSVESVSLAVLRGIEDHMMRDSRNSVTVLTTAQVALYILNNKRAYIIDMESRYGVSIQVQSSDRMQGANFAIERSAVPVQPKRTAERAAVNMNWGFDGEDGEEATAVAATDDAVHVDHHDAEHHDAEPRERPRHAEERRGEDERAGGREDGGRRRRRRRRRRGRGDEQGEGRFEADRPHRADADHPRDGDEPTGSVSEIEDDDHAPEEINGAGPDAAADEDTGEPRFGADGEEGGREDGGRRRRRRRGRRGGRRRDRENGVPGTGDQPMMDDVAAAGDGPRDDADDAPHANGGEPADDREPMMQTSRGEEERSHERDPEPMITASSHQQPEEPQASKLAAYDPPPSPQREPVHASNGHTPEPVVTVTPEPEPPRVDEPARPARTGWWRRRGADA